MNQAYADKEIDGILSSIRDTIEEEMKEIEDKPQRASKVVHMAEAPKNQPPRKPVLKAAPPISTREEVLDLTKMIREDGTVIDIREKEKHLKSQENSTLFSRKNKENSSNMPLTSQDAFSESARALRALAENVKGIKERENSSKTSSSHADSLTVENLMRDLLRPLLKDWLDAYLPSIVKALVSEEIQKISRESRQTSTSRESLK